MKKKKQESGQAIVEVALALSIISLLLCAIIDFGRILYSSETLNLVNQDAVRYAGLGKTNEFVKAYVVNNAPLTGIDANKITFTPASESRDPGTYVTVSISYDVKIITPIISNILDNIDEVHDGNFTIKTNSTIRVE